MRTSNIRWICTLLNKNFHVFYHIDVEVEDGFNKTDKVTPIYYHNSIILFKLKLYRWWYTLCWQCTKLHVPSFPQSISNTELTRILQSLWCIRQSLTRHIAQNYCLWYVACETNGNNDGDFTSWRAYCNTHENLLLLGLLSAYQ